MFYKCECCGYFTLPEENTGNYNNCPICFLEDDVVQLEDPDYEVTCPDFLYHVDLETGLC